MYQEWFEKYKKITNESKADEMFKNLSYKVEENIEGNKLTFADGDNYIEFDLKYKNIRSYFWGMFDQEPCCITLEELKAINEKVKELGWLDEK